jgi:putative tryptophan/tyrosine transport system substrate-binding protein
MKRREFITLFGGAAVTWPLAARAQQPDRVRRIGVLMGVTKDEPEGQARIAALREGLQKLGWTDGRNIRIEERWADGGIDSVRTYAAEMVKLAPDLIVANGTPFVEALHQATRSIPIVFVLSNDPVGLGHVASMARAGRRSSSIQILLPIMSPICVRLKPPRRRCRWNSRGRRFVTRPNSKA